MGSLLPLSLVSKEEVSLLPARKILKLRPVLQFQSLDWPVSSGPVPWTKSLITSLEGKYIFMEVS